MVELLLCRASIPLVVGAQWGKRLPFVTSNGADSSQGTLGWGVRAGVQQGASPGLGLWLISQNPEISLGKIILEFILLDFIPWT